MKCLRIPATIAAVACCIALAMPARAQNQSSAPAKAQGHAPTQKQLDIKAARAERKAIVGQNMDLTPAEAKAFWPLYDQYEAKMDKIEDRHIREVRDFARHYASLTEADAKQKLDETVAIAQARIDVQRAFIPKFRAVMPQVKVTRFFQIDNKLHALVQCQIAQMVPLARSAGSSESGDL